MPAVAQRLNLRLFLEGIEVPCVAAQVVASPNGPMQCVIQVPPSSMGTKLMPRTLVHLFFLDPYERNTMSPTSLTDDPTTYEQAVMRRNNGTADSASDEDFANDKSNDLYKLLFAGEVMGYQWTKNQASRSLVLQCVDLSNYWDYAYQFNNTDIFGPGYKALFSGGSTNLMTDFMTSPGEVVTSLLHQTSVQYPKLKGLLGGIVRIIESIGGSYYYDKTFQGQNVFFSIAELRLHITQMVTAYDDDDTADRLLNADGWEPLFGRILGGLGEQVSIRDVMNSIAGTIFHETYAQPCPKYLPGTGGSTNGLGRKKIANVPQLAGLAALAENAQVEIDQVVRSINNTAIVDTAPGAEATTITQKPAEVLVVQMDRLKKSLQQGASWSNQLNLPAAVPLFASAATSLGVAITKLKRDWAPGRSGRKIDDITNALNNAIDQIVQVQALEVNSISKDKATPARLNSHIIRPDIWFGPPPRCNVIFPENYDSLSFSRVFMQEPTRLLLKTNEEFVGENELFDSFYFAPKQRTAKGQQKTLQALFNNDIFDHELFVGVLPVFEKMGEINILAVRSGTTDSTLPKVSLAQRSTNFLYFKYRFSSRKMSIHGKFNPYVAVGFPGLIIDKYIDLNYLSTIHSLMQQHGKYKPPELQKYLGSHYLGAFTQVTHSLDQRNGSTSIDCSYPRQHDETSEFLGPTMQDDQTVMQKTGADAARFTVCAVLQMPALGSIGPNYGVISNAQSAGLPPPQPGTTVDNAQSLPVFLGVNVDGGNLTASAPIGIPVAAGSVSAAVANYVGDPNRLVTFQAVTITEKVPQYRQTTIQLPPEEYIRPGWYSNTWHPLNIGKVYNFYFGIGSIVDPTTITPSDGSSLAPQNADASEALTDTQNSTGADDPKNDISTLLTLDAKASIEQATDFLVMTYSYVKQSDSDVNEFIRAYTWRSIATMLDMFGTSDLQFSSDGTTVVRGIEGFHSRAFGNYNNLFGLVTPDIESILGVSRTSAAAQRMDVRGRKFQAVGDFVSSLQFSRAIIG